ncbi:MAG: flagellar hook-length control protein FliK [Rhodospirillaceae bacterium]
METSALTSRLNHDTSVTTIQSGGGSNFQGDSFANLFSQFSSSLIAQANVLSRSVALPVAAAPMQPLPASTRAASPAFDQSAAARSAADNDPPSRSQGDDESPAKTRDDSAPTKVQDRPGARSDKVTKTAGRTESARSNAGKADKAARADHHDSADRSDQAKASDASDKVDQADDASTNADADTQHADSDSAVTRQAAAQIDLDAAQLVAAAAMPAQSTQAQAKPTLNLGGRVTRTVAGGGKETAVSGDAKGGLEIAGAVKAGTDKAAAGKAEDAAIAVQTAATGDSELADASAESGTAALLKSFGDSVGKASAATASTMTAAAAPRTMMEPVVPMAAGVIPVAAADSKGDASKDTGGGLTGDGSARRGQNGQMLQDINNSAALNGAAEGPRQTGSGQDFATQLASVRQTRPGMPTSATDQVSVQLQRGVKDGSGSISMQLRPEELGRIDVRLDIGKDGAVNAMITADRPLTLDLLQRDSKALERALQDAGLQTSAGSLNFGLRGEGGQNFNQGANQDGNNRNGNGNRTASALDETKDSAPSDVNLVMRRYQVAPGRVDVKI